MKDYDTKEAQSVESLIEAAWEWARAEVAEFGHPEWLKEFARVVCQRALPEDSHTLANLSLSQTWYNGYLAGFASGRQYQRMESEQVEGDVEM